MERREGGALTKDEGRKTRDEGALGLYLHIPFCAHICNYCNFNRGLFDERLKREYVDALVQEIRASGDGATPTPSSSAAARRRSSTLRTSPD